MEPNNPIVEVLKTINQLSGEALKALTQGGGRGGEGAPPAPGRDEPPAEAAREGE